MDKIKASQFANLAYYGRVQPLLPAEYQQVEYLQSASGQYISTGFIPNQRYKTVVDGAMISDSTVLLGCHSSTDPNWSHQMSFGIQKAGGVFRGFSPLQGFTNYNPINIKSADANRHIFIDDWLTPQYKVDESSATPSDYFPSFYSNDFYLFGRNQRGSQLNGGTMKAYSVQIYNSAGKLVLNYVPCYRKSDSKPGMYDLVSRTFVTNSGSGDFTVGGNV